MLTCRFHNLGLSIAQKVKRATSCNPTNLPPAHNGTKSSKQLRSRSNRNSSCVLQCIHYPFLGPPLGDDPAGRWPGPSGGGLVEPLVALVAQHHHLGQARHRPPLLLVGLQTIPGLRSVGDGGFICGVAVAVIRQRRGGRGRRRRRRGGRVHEPGRHEISQCHRR
jgi:hypothetical protein